jgi:hypothetical protein
MRIPYWRMSLLGLVFASRMAAASCSTASLASYIGLGAAGCTVNGVLVNDFNFLVVATSLGSPLTSGAITVTPTFTANKYDLLFSATGLTPSTGFTVSGADFAKYEIDFNWDPVVVGAEDELDVAPVFPGTATVTTKLCNGQAFGGATCPTFASPTNTLTVFSDGKPADLIATADTALVPPACLMGPPVCAPTVVIGTTSLVDLEANGASSQITGFDTSVFTPEPGTLFLTAAGLALAWRRFRRTRQPGL